MVKLMKILFLLLDLICIKHLLIFKRRKISKGGVQIKL
jgi:hypothetical protein